VFALVLASSGIDFLTKSDGVIRAGVGASTMQPVSR
jgi:hypothetical protein